MLPCHVVKIVTPKKYILNGLWFGPKRPKRAIVWVHGLSSSVFSMRPVVEQLASSDTAVLTFNNHGFEKISEVKRRHGMEEKWKQSGAAHEVFTDCVDDIQGAVNFARRQGTKRIFLAGHSTGCQKSIYWAYRKKGRGVKGVILLAPVSDWAAETKRQGTRKITRVAAAAGALVKRGKKHQLLPPGLWHEVLDAQRFLSLYMSDSVEEVFSYAQPKKNPRALKSVHKPILVFWAEKDQFGSSHSAPYIMKWFEQHMRSGKTVIVPRVGHSFRGAEKRVAQTIRHWIDSVEMR